MRDQVKNKKTGVISESVGNYEKHPFFIKKAAQDEAFLKSAGLPSDLHKKTVQGKNQSTGAFVSPKTQHVVKHENGWAVKGSGNEKVTVIRTTQREAIETAREIARNKGAEVIIHGRDGKIRHRDSYDKKK